MQGSRCIMFHPEEDRSVDTMPMKKIPERILLPQAAKSSIYIILRKGYLESTQQIKNSCGRDCTQLAQSLTTGLPRGLCEMAHSKEIPVAVSISHNGLPPLLCTLNILLNGRQALCRWVPCKTPNKLHFTHTKNYIKILN